MNVRTNDKKDLIINQGMELLLDLLKQHLDDGVCEYAFLELTLGEGIDDFCISNIKNRMLKSNGKYKVKKYDRKSRTSQLYSIDDIVESLIRNLSMVLRHLVLDKNSQKIIEKYSTYMYFKGIELYLKKILLGVEEMYYDEAEEMVKEYILEA